MDELRFPTLRSDCHQQDRATHGDAVQAGDDRHRDAQHAPGRLRVADVTAFYYLGKLIEVGRGPKKSSPRRIRSKRKITSPAASANRRAQADQNPASTPRSTAYFAIDCPQAAQKDREHCYCELHRKNSGLRMSQSVDCRDIGGYSILTYVPAEYARVILYYSNHLQVILTLEPLCSGGGMVAC